MSTDGDTSLAVRIRMYSQGLGDCFLLTFYRGDPNHDTVFNILIDCGVLENRQEDADRMREVAAQIKAEANNHIHLLVATHRHWDHLSGFLQAKDIFDDEALKIDQIWASWTENSDDPQAMEMWKSADTSFAAIYTSLNLGLGKEKAANSAISRGQQSNADNKSDSGSELRRGIVQLLGFSGEPLDEEPLPTELQVEGAGLAAKGVRKDPKGAMQYILGRSFKSPRFLEPKTDAPAEPIALDELEGVRFYVLGPPRDAKYLRHFDPKKSDPKDTIYGLMGPAFASSFIAAMLDQDRRQQGTRSNKSVSTPTHNAAADDDNIHLHMPFDDRYGCTLEQLQDSKKQTHVHIREFFARHYGLDELQTASAGKAGSTSRTKKLGAWRRIDDNWMDAAGELALWLNSVVNNTSLALAIELVQSGKVLLFVADAQIGNWQSWSELSWTIREKDKETSVVRISDLLGRTVLYKVGHHGSRNATLDAQGLSLMTSTDLVAMIPVNEETAHRQKTGRTPGGWLMPAPKLHAALEKKTRGRVLQADKPLPTREQLQELGLLTNEQAAFNDASTKEPLWIDLVIKDE